MYRKTALALSFVALAAACHSSSTLTGPTQKHPVSLAIAGPPNVAPGQTVGYMATAKMSDGSSADYTQKVVWNTSPVSVLTISSTTGQATGQAAGDATVRAIIAGSAGGSAGCCTSTAPVVVVPTNTYRLVGQVLESSLPVVSASIVVLSGIGAGLSATTDSAGEYRLYGVAGPLQVKFSKAGYDDIVKSFTVAQNDVLDFPEAHQTAAIPSLAGSYTLTLTADSTCPLTATTGPRPLEDALRQPRTYGASLTQDGPALTVTLTDSTILPQANHFSGRVSPDGVQFQVGDLSYYYYYSDSLTNGVTERLSSTLAFTFTGAAQTHKSGTTLTGALNGRLEESNMTPVQVVEECVSANNQFVLTRAAQTSRHR